jgi:hypothetical protein
MGSTLSLAMVQRDNSEQVRQLQAEWAEESVRIIFFFQQIIKIFLIRSLKFLKHFSFKQQQL